MRKIDILLAFLLLFSACNLDREPYGISKWETPEAVELALNAVYEPYYQEEGFGRGHWLLGGASSDDMYLSPQAWTELKQVINFEPAGENNNVSHVHENWKLMYQSIRRANDVMKYANEVQMDEKRRDMMLAEANFLCAFNYFFLAKRYGGLPFYDYKEPTEINKARETKEDTYMKIEAYLKESIALFEKYGVWKRDDKDFGRPHLGAAYGLLAKLYAHWAAGPERDEKYKLCKEAAQIVIDSEKYTLNSNKGNGYADLFSLEGEKHEEVLFNLNCSPVRHKGTVSSIILMPLTLADGAGWSTYSPTKNLYDAFEEGDLRRRVTIIKEGDEVAFLGEKKIISSLELYPFSLVFDGFMCAKYSAAYNDLSSWQWESGADIPLLRYADVLLLHAEAEIALGAGGPEEDKRTVGVAAAAKSLNEVRVRAFGGDVSKAITAPTFEDLAKERRCELAYEDERHFDLIRWGWAKEIYPKIERKKNFDPVKHAHFPIPQKEIEDTEELIINNPNQFYSTFD